MLLSLMKSRPLPGTGTYRLLSLPAASYVVRVHAVWPCGPAVATARVGLPSPSQYCTASRESVPLALSIVTVLT